MLDISNVKVSRNVWFSTKKSIFRGDLCLQTAHFSQLKVFSRYLGKFCISHMFQRFQWKQMVNQQIHFFNQPAG